MGAIRKVDELGRIGLPKLVRENLSIEEGDLFEIVTQGGNIILVRHLVKCFVCNYDDDVQKIGSAYLCYECREKLGAAS